MGGGQIALDATVDFDPWEKDEVGGSATVKGTLENGGTLLKQFGTKRYLLAMQATFKGKGRDKLQSPPAHAAN